jgi:hypothetical protein
VRPTSSTGSTQGEPFVSTSRNLEKSPHIDYGYVVTSQGSQGQTADRVLIHIDTEQAGEKLVNQRLAYVAVSRGRYDAQVYTNDALALRDALSRDGSKSVVLEVSVSPSKEQSERIVADHPSMSTVSRRASWIEARLPHEVWSNGPKASETRRDPSLDPPSSVCDRIEGHHFPGFTYVRNDH